MKSPSGLPKAVVLPFLLFGLTIGCRAEPTSLPPGITAEVAEVHGDAWKTLSRKTLYFAHQSVGYDILKGVGEWIDHVPAIGLAIEPLTGDPIDAPAGRWYHSPVGHNGRPFEKLKSFSATMEAGWGDVLDVAFIKFCYLDVSAGFDSRQLFDTYQKTMERIARRFPRLTLLHFTVPLTSRQTGPKAWLKKAVGKPLRGFEDNVAREQFNAMMRAAYAGRGLLFDLAAVESAAPDGAPVFFERAGKRYPSLAPAYTDDGAHLNHLGRQVVAGRLLLFLTKRLAGLQPKTEGAEP